MLQLEQLPHLFVILKYVRLYICHFSFKKKRTNKKEIDLSMQHRFDHCIIHCCLFSTFYKFYSCFIYTYIFRKSSKKITFFIYFIDWRGKFKAHSNV